MAAHELDATLDLPIADTDTVVRSASQAQDARDWPVAAVLWAQARALAPDYPHAYSNGALALREAGDPAEAKGVT